MPRYENFDRQYRMSAGPGGGGGFIAGTGDYPLHVSFAFQKSDIAACNTGKIDIWNLNDSHIAVLEQDDCMVIFNAGYKDRMARIFIGNVCFCSTSISGGDRITHIEVVDGLYETSEVYMLVSYKGKTNWKVIVDDVAAQMGIPVTYAPTIKKWNDIENGFTYAGLAKNILDKACKCNNLTWSINNGILEVKPPYQSIRPGAFTISPETGLIGNPEKVMLTKEVTPSENVIGWDVKFLLNGAVEVGELVNLRSKWADGVYYVKSLSHSGDNMSGDWMSSARLIEEAS